MLAWYVADMKTGGFIEELPLKVGGTIERTMGVKTTCQVDLDVRDPSCPPRWDQTIDPRRAMIVPVLDDRPLCAYRITAAPDIGGPTVPLSLESLEGIPDVVYVDDLDFAATDDAQVAAGLLAKVADGWGFELDVTNTGTSGDYTFSSFEDRTIGSALSDLTSKEGGPEWVTRIRWEDGTHRRFIKSIEIGPQVGRRIPSTVFENHHLSLRRRSRSWAKIAVRTRATGDGIGESRPMSPAVVDEASVAAGIPPWEMRVSAPTVDSDSGLLEVAQAAATRYLYGTQTWDLSIAQTEPGAPELIRDYDVGDTVTMDLGPTPDDHATWRGVGRVIGWRARIEGRTVIETTPVFYNPDEED